MYYNLRFRSLKDLKNVGVFVPDDWTEFIELNENESRGPIDAQIGLVFGRMLSAVSFNMHKKNLLIDRAMGRYRGNDKLIIHGWLLTLSILTERSRPYRRMIDSLRKGDTSLELFDDELPFENDTCKVMSEHTHMIAKEVLGASTNKLAVSLEEKMFQLGRQGKKMQPKVKWLTSMKIPKQ